MSAVDTARLDALFADLRDRSGEVEPITRAERDARVARLAALLAERRLDACLLEPGTTLRYLSSLPWERSERLFALLVQADGSCLWVAPGFERRRAEALVAEHGPEGDV